MKNVGLSSFGQHYLIDKDVMNRILSISSVSPSDIVIEIGAGDGRLTQELAKRCKWVYSYEIDPKTQAILEELEKQYNNTTIYITNFLNSSIPLCANKIVANLPYQITEPFIGKIILLPIQEIYLLTGITYAEHVCMEKLIRKTSILTNCFYYPKIELTVDKNAFNPPPRTKSAVISLKKKSKVELEKDINLFIMRELFEQRDKKTVNALREALIRFYHIQGHILTKKESKKLINTYIHEFPNVNIEKQIENMTNQEIVNLYSSLVFFEPFI